MRKVFSFGMKASALAALMLSACTSSEDSRTGSRTNASIQNLYGSGRLVYLAVFHDMEPLCVGGGRAKSAARQPSITAILLDSLPLQEYDKDLSLKTKIALVSKLDADTQSVLHAQVSIQGVSNTHVIGTYRLYDSLGTPVGTTLEFAARKCPDLSADD